MTGCLTRGKDPWSLTQVCIIRVRLSETEDVRHSEKCFRSSLVTVLGRIFAGDMHASGFNEKIFHDVRILYIFLYPRKDIRGLFFWRWWVGRRNQGVRYGSRGSSFGPTISRLRADQSLDFSCLGSIQILGGGFKYFFMFTPIWGNDPF